MKARRKHPFTPDYTSAPGPTLIEQMEYLEVTVEMLAERAGLSRAQAQGLLNGTTPLTDHIAEVLEDLTGTPASFWQTYEAHYRDGLAKGLIDVTPTQEA